MSIIFFCTISKDTNDTIDTKGKIKIEGKKQTEFIIVLFLKHCEQLNVAFILFISETLHFRQ